MNLPPSIAKIYFTCDGEELVRRVAHEACRLQREADNEASRKIQVRHGSGSGFIKLTGPLVVPEAE